MGQHGSVFRVPAWCILLDSSAPRYHGVTQAGCCRASLRWAFPGGNPQGRQSGGLSPRWRPPLKVAIQTQSWMNVLRCRACSWITDWVWEERWWSSRDLLFWFELFKIMQTLDDSGPKQKPPCDLKLEFGGVRCLNNFSWLKASTW